MTKAICGAASFVHFPQTAFETSQNWQKWHQFHTRFGCIHEDFFYHHFGVERPWQKGNLLKIVIIFLNSWFNQLLLSKRKPVYNQPNKSFWLQVKWPSELPENVPNIANLQGSPLTYKVQFQTLVGCVAQSSRMEGIVMNSTPPKWCKIVELFAKFKF